MQRVPPLCRKDGFSLIELLVAVGIIVILATLVIDGAGHMLVYSAKANCASNLRQIGMAIQEYSQEHAMTLPGPLWTGQHDFYSTGDPGQLLYFIAPYLGYPAPGTTVRQGKIMTCPAWKSYVKQNLVGWPYTLNLQATGINGKLVAPFGYPSSVGSDGSTKSGVNPLQVAALKSLSGTWLLEDMDQQNQPSYAGNSQVPPTPVHVNLRNVLYLDGHVAATNSQ